MTLELYKVLHLIGFALLMMSAGVALATPKDAPQKTSMIFHGVGLILLLVAGFGMLAKPEFANFSSPENWPIKLWIKLSIWIGAAILPTLVRRGFVPRPFLWIVALGLASYAAYLGITIRN
jgi:uncharacterized membrane protein SirB2